MGGNRKLGSITLGLVLLLALFAAGCGGSTTTSAALATSESTPAASDTTVTTETTATTAASADYKVAVVSPPFSASEDEYRGGQTVKKKYGDMIVHLVLPDDFTGEQETVLSQITSLGDDPQVKAIVIAAGYTGILPALIKVKESRPDIKIITAPIWDDPDQMAKYVDLALDTDAIKRGVNIVQKAKEMGATTLIHYSFPSHMQKELLAQRRDTMEAEAEKNGMTFVAIMTPDPFTSDNGTTAMQQFLSEDVPKEIEKYGKDTAIFGTNCGMQEVIISKVVETGAIMPEQCCPTPTQGFPAALGIEIDEENAGDVDALNAQIKDKLAAADMAGRLSTWPIPLGIFFPEFGVEVAKMMIEDDFDGRDPEVLASLAEEVAGVKVSFDTYKGYDNYYMIIMESIFY
ncbi:MAG: DUF3798 domain-containing protein [Gaiellales bacterium]|nr:DUF3798 domain-containing protein [Gaiellales bacterium]